MSTIKILFTLSIYLYSVNLLYKDNSVIALIVITLIAVIFTIEYFRMYEKLKKSENNYYEALKEKNKNFIEILNHDLRVPTLAQLRGIEILKKNSLGKISTGEKDLILQVEDSCRYVLKMIGMIISIYHFENNNRKLIYEKFNMSELVFACFDELSEKAYSKQITFAYDSNELDTNVEADKEEIHKVISNLLISAINSSDFAGNILVNIRIIGKFLQLSIKNDNYLKANFEEYKTLNYTTVGENIGMELNKKIIEFHKGQIYTEQDKLNHHSFSFVIPRFLDNLLCV